MKPQVRPEVRRRGGPDRGPTDWPVYNSRVILFVILFVIWVLSGNVVIHEVNWVRFPPLDVKHANMQ